VDEGLQIHGGYGFTEEFPLARAYRDARINRIFEGTNEINRLATIDHAVRRALKGRLPLMEAEAKLREIIMNPTPAEVVTEPLEEIKTWVDQIRNVTMYSLGQAFQILGQGLIDKQEVVAAGADMACYLLALESAWLRLQKLEKTATPEIFETALACVQVFGNDACNEVEKLARYTISAITEGDDRRTHASILRRLLKAPMVDTLDARRKIAKVVIDREAYPFS
jgi:alkylation response protein AidB-like acyl-CoA dehydrogenase